MRFLFFFLSLLIATNVQASGRRVGPSSGVLFVDFPEACVENKKFPCTIRSAKISLKFEMGSVQYSLDSGSAIQVEAGDRFQLLEGKLWVESKGPSILKLGNNLKMHFQGEIFCEKQKDMSLQVRNLNAQINFDSKYVFKEESLPVGFENWYGAVATDGQILRGIIRPIQKESFFAVWMPLAASSAAELRKKAKEYLDLWADSVNQSANLYQEIVQRRLASIKEKENLSYQKQKIRRQEQDELRRLYREKNGL